jgi:nitrite reductase/ring-hydroxylating ferredoxin subunit
MAPEVRLCPVEAIREGEARGFDPSSTGADTMFALRRRGIVRAYRNSCPHQSVPLEYRKDRFLSPDGQHIICFAHGARFESDTGVCVHGPCLGQSLEALPYSIVEDWLWVRT